ncbi:trans-sialidase, partial [Trypanosoma cruzi]
MRMPQWCQRLLDRRLAHRSPQKVPSMPAGKTRRKHNRGHSRWTTREFASSTAEMPRRWELGMRLLGVPQPARRHVSDGMLATFVRTALALLTRYCNSIQQQQDDKL